MDSLSQSAYKVDTKNGTWFDLRKDIKLKWDLGDQ